MAVSAEGEPEMKKVFLVGAALLGFLVAFNILGWLGRANQVIQSEFDPQELLRKYEWFKDAAAQLDKKLADIQVYRENIIQMREDYGDVLRTQWDRTDRIQFNQWNIELAGVRASYNALAAEYNAQSSKFNWPDLLKVDGEPKGGLVDLPHEFKPYNEIIVIQ